MNMKNRIAAGFAVILIMALALPAFAQSGENNAYQAIKDERDARKQKSLIEDFVGKYPSSQFRPDLDLQLMGLYFDNKDLAQMVKHADSFALTQASADAKSRTKFFTLAMEAARQLGNQSKFNEFADRALSADPNNVSVLMTMARTLSETGPTDAAGLNAQMDKALGYATRARNATKPAATSDADWQAAQERLSGIFGFIYLNKQKWDDSVKEYTTYLRKNAVDGMGQFRFGVASYNQVQITLTTLQDTYSRAKAAQTAGNEAQLEVLSKSVEQLSKDFEAQRDVTIDALAKALAVGGPYADQARKMLEPLYKQKHNTADDMDKFILDKKTELAALAPLPAPTVAPSGRGGNAPPAGGNAARPGR